MADFTISRSTLDTLTLADVEEISGLFKRCSDYFVLQDGVAATSADAHDLFLDLPPGFHANDQSVFGWRNSGQLAALVVILRAYPDADIWYLGLLIVDPERRSAGVGRAIYSVAERWAAEEGAREVRLAVLEANVEAHRFWCSIGFRQRRRVGPDNFKSKTHYRIELARSLNRPGFAGGPNS